MTAQGKPFCVDLALKPHSMAKICGFYHALHTKYYEFF